MQKRVAREKKRFWPAECKNARKNWEKGKSKGSNVPYPGYCQTSLTWRSEQDEDEVLNHEGDAERKRKKRGSREERRYTIKKLETKGYRNLSERKNRLLA